MRNLRLWILTAIIASCFSLQSTKVWAASSDIVITEIMAYPTVTADEWVELFNRGTSPVDLNGWVFYENATRHGMKVAGPSTVLLPGAYAIIAENSTTFASKYSLNNILLFDSSWSTGLAANGEQIGLKDASDAFVEVFTYPASTHGSLERVDAFASAAVANSWKERASGDSAGFGTSVSSAPVPTSTPVVTVNLPTPTSTPTSSNQISSATTAGWATMRLNEISPTPASGSEWVELYNPGALPVDLSGGTLCDDRSTACSIAALSGIIPSHGFLTISITGSKLNNDGDSVILKDPAGDIVDQMSYGANLLPMSGQVLARTIDGAGSWVVSIISTMGAANVISIPPSTAATQASSVGMSDSVQPDAPLMSANGSKGIYWYATSSAPVNITELLPNPDGEDTRDEFVELRNHSEETVDLFGWKLSIDDAFFELSGRLEPDEIIVLKRSQTHLELRNTTSSVVRLLNPDLAIVHEVRYPYPAPSGLSYAETLPGRWHWSKSTPRNVISVDTKLWQLGAPRTGLVNEPITFNIGTLPDTRGGAWSAVWKTLGQKKIGSSVQFIFPTSGVYTILVSATSSMGSTAATSTDILIREDGVATSGAVTLSEVYAAPESAAEGFIEIYNSGTQPVRLDDWFIKVTSGKTYHLPDDTVLPPGGRLVFYDAITECVVKKSGDSVVLFDSARLMRDRVVVPKIPEGSSYQKIGGSWYVTEAPSPGVLGIMPSVKTETKQSTSTPKKISKKLSTKKSAEQNRSAVSGTSRFRKGTRLNLEGIITAVPGVFGAQYAVIALEEGGMFLYQNKKDFPALDYGDRVRVAGMVSETGGRQRLNIKGQSAFDIISTDSEIDPVDIRIDRLVVADAGSLVRVHGELTAKTTKSGFIDDGTDELPFVIKTGTKISTKTWRVGSVLSMTGILVTTPKGFELWPRSGDDVYIENMVSSSATSSAALASVVPSQAAKKDLVYPVLVGGLLLMNTGLLWRLYRLRVGVKPGT